MTMAPEKVTVMILDVDLKCCSCYKKVKKVLCKFPQIRDQAFDEDKNKVRITVVCCNPEKLRDKLCCKGGKAIRRIEIVEDKPQKHTKDEKHNPPIEGHKPPNGTVQVPVETPPQAKSPKKPKSDPTRGCPQPVYVPVCCSRCHGRPCECGCGRPPPVDPPACCPQCYEGRHGGPCEYVCRWPVPSPPVNPPACCRGCSEGRGGWPCECGCGRPGPCYCGYRYRYCGNRPMFVCVCDCVSEENPQGCAIM